MQDSLVCDERVNTRKELLSIPHSTPSVIRKLNKHDIKAKPIEDSFPQTYKDAFVNNSADFATHAAEKKWSKTKLQCFQNNKHQYSYDGPGGTAWMMDEPNEYLDWRAINFYSALFHDGVKKSGAKDVQFVYRADVSRAMWQGSVSDGLMEMSIVPAGEAFNTPYLLREHKRRMPTELVAYGGANENSRPNLESAAWCIKCYVYECDGALRWLLRIARIIERFIEHLHGGTKV